MGQSRDQSGLKQARVTLSEADLARVKRLDKFSNLGGRLYLKSCAVEIAVGVSTEILLVSLSPLDFSDFSILVFYFHPKLCL